MNPVVSVVLPFRNAGDTLSSAVRSVLAQWHRDFELILVDDHSSDAWRDGLREVHDPRIRFLENLGRPGVVGAMATGVEASSGEWIARMDADDVCLPGRLGTSLKRASEPDCPGVVCGGVRVSQPLGAGMSRYVDWVNGLQSHDEISAGRFIESPVINPSMMIRRDWWDRVGGYHDPDWAEDHDLWLRLLEVGCRFAKVNEVLIDWRDSENRLTRTDPRYGGEARLRMRAFYLSRLPGVERTGVVVAGAGPNGKRLCLELQALGVKVVAFAEVHPRRVGQVIHGVPVLSTKETLERRGQAVVIGAAGGESSRKKLREWAAGAELKEGATFWQTA